MYPVFPHSNEYYWNTRLLSDASYGTALPMHQELMLAHN